MGQEEPRISGRNTSGRVVGNNVKCDGQSSMRLKVSGELRIWDSSRTKVELSFMNGDPLARTLS